MSSSIKNVYQFRTTSKITQAQGVASTFTIGNDVFTNSSVTITGGSVKLENRTGSQVELMTITATGGTATIATRGILPDGTTSTNYQYERPRNTLCTVTVLENQITNKVTTNTFTEDQTIESGNKLKLGANAYVWTENDGTDLKFKDASNTEKTLTQLASLSGSNDKVKITSNDTTEAFLASKLTGGDGITVTEINDGGNETLDIDIDLTDTTKFSSSGVASRAVITDGSGNMFQATTTARGGVELATPTEVATRTDTTRAVTPEGIATVTQRKVLQTTRATDAASGTSTLAHGLTTTPRWCYVVAMITTTSASSFGESFSHGWWDGTSQGCTYTGTTDAGATTGRLGGNNASNAIYMLHGSSSSEGIQAGVISADATNVTITRTKSNTPPAGSGISVTLFCHT